MMPVYINGSSCISAQSLHGENFLEGIEIPEPQALLDATEPDYKEYISPAQIRRMSKSVKMSMAAAKIALAEAGCGLPDAIIVGTGMGCEQDSEKVLKTLTENNEEFLTPTSFIQSTHNTVAGQIALGIGCHAYNFTYVNPGSSLEFSLLDAQLQLQNGEAKNVLAGATDEKAQRTMELFKLINLIKKESDLPADYLQSETAGVTWGEGAAFFVLSQEKHENTTAQLIDIEIINKLAPEDITKFILHFIEKNNLAPGEIDAVMLGYSAHAESDIFYHRAAKIFGGSQLLYFKHLCGEYNTASGFAFFMANRILQAQRIPPLMKINDAAPKEIRNVLIYNNFFGKDHALVLLKKI